jgi:hypothetical protein
MGGIVNMGLRALALLWTLLITALIGNVIADNVNARTSAESAINFTMFVAVLSWIVLLYGLAATFITSLARPMILLPLEGLATLFTFIAAIVLAAKLGVPNCSNVSDRSHSRSWIAYGSNDTEKRCREIQASTAFMWFLWACFVACLGLTFKDSRGGYGGSVRSSRPAMSQV